MAHLRHVDAVRADGGGDERGLRPARVDREAAREVAAGPGHGRNEDGRRQRRQPAYEARRLGLARSGMRASACCILPGTGSSSRPA